MLTPLILIGFKSVGKTTLGKALAQQLELPFYDSDLLLGESARDLYLRIGPQCFAAAEQRALDQLPRKEAYLLATGGSTPLHCTLPEGTVVHVREAKETVRERIFAGDLPAFLDRCNPVEHFEELFSARVAYYETICDHSIEAEGLWQVIDSAPTFA